MSASPRHPHATAQGLGAPVGIHPHPSLRPRGHSRTSESTDPCQPCGQSSVSPVSTVPCHPCHPRGHSPLSPLSAQSPTSPLDICPSYPYECYPRVHLPVASCNTPVTAKHHPCVHPQDPCMNPTTFHMHPSSHPRSPHALVPSPTRACHITRMCSPPSLLHACAPTCPHPPPPRCACPRGHRL